MSDPGFRSLEVRAKSFREDERSVEAVISTEAPVLMPDWSRGELVPEVLLARGAEFPKSRQIPFLDSHNRSSIKDQLGSARNITVGDGNITATLMFSKAAQAEDAMAGVREGHITDVSVGYDVLKRTYIAEGQTKTISGREFTGPVNVVTKWRLREVSLTPIGADAQAKLRGLDPAAVRFSQEGFEMNQELRALLVSRGMPAEFSDDQAQRWLVDNASKLAATQQPPPEPTRAAPVQPTAPALTADDVARMIAEGTRKALEAQHQARTAFETEARGLCELADMADEFDAVRGFSDVNAVREHLKKAKAERSASIPFGGTISIGKTGQERLSGDLRAAMIVNAVRFAANGDTAKIEKHTTDVERKAAAPFAHATLMDMATEYVRGMGVSTFGLSREKIAQAAMFGPEKAGLSGRSVTPYHTTGNFANLTLDAINKSMMIGYTEVPATWRGPMRQGLSVADFKTIHRLRHGGIPNLPAWNDVERPNRVSFADAKESYAVECYSEGIDFSYKLIVNDDMDALTRVPLGLGDAAARTVNAVAWSQITSNPLMSDGVALFSDVSGNRKQKNLETGSVSNYTTAINLLTQNMMVMRGENTPEGGAGPDILGLMPAYICVPAALRATILTLLQSTADPYASQSGVANINRNLQLIVEPLLDANSATAWYLFAEPRRIDTVEVTFLQGQETPQIRTVPDEHNLSITYYVLQTFGAKALNHRGMQRHTGA
jgi:hypothetical protein